jgi:hypothetical protein
MVTTKKIRCENSTGMDSDNAISHFSIHNPHPSGSDSSGRYGFWNLSGEVRPSLMKISPTHEFHSIRTLG